MEYELSLLVIMAGVAFVAGALWMPSRGGGGGVD